MRKVLMSFIIILTAVLNAQELNPGDGVRILFYNIPEKISGDYFIQQDGRIQLPYIGLIETRQRDFKDIQSEISLKYDSLYRDPELTLSLIHIL